MTPAGQSLVHDLLQSVKEKLKKEQGNGTNRMVMQQQQQQQKGGQDHKKDAELPVSYRLKNIRSLVTPELLFALAKAGDGDTVVLAANGFPANRYPVENSKVTSPVQKKQQQCSFSWIWVTS